MEERKELEEPVVSIQSESKELEERESGARAINPARSTSTPLVSIQSEKQEGLQDDQERVRGLWAKDKASDQNQHSQKACKSTALGEAPPPWWDSSGRH